MATFEIALPSHRQSGTSWAVTADGDTVAFIAIGQIWLSSGAFYRLVDVDQPEGYVTVERVQLGASVDGDKYRWSIGSLINPHCHPIKTADSALNCSNPAEALRFVETDTLVREYQGRMRDCFNAIFGHAASRAQDLIGSELIQRGITEIPNLFGSIEVNDNWFGALHAK